MDIHAYVQPSLAAQLLATVQADDEADCSVMTSCAVKSVVIHDKLLRYSNTSMLVPD